MSAPLDDQAPHKPAAILGTSGRTLTFARLSAESKQLAQCLHAAGLRRGDTIAILMDNTDRYFTAAWGARRAGLFFTPVNWHLTPTEAAYIVRDCGARALVTSATLIDLASTVAQKNQALEVKLCAGASGEGFSDLEEALAHFPAEPLAEELDGVYMFYSSGTTGQPKGIRPVLKPRPFGSPLRVEQLLANLYGVDAGTRYLSAGPLYHGAPLGWSLGVQRLGGSVVIMERFDAEQTLALIERYRITHAQFVPTMLVRMLNLPEAVRKRYDLTSLRYAVHAAAPCPIALKRAMIEWFGPVVHEYYAGSEGNCFFAIDSPTWLERPGSVGRPMLGAVHICADDGTELPTGEVGQVWFEGTPKFEYHNDPDKTASAFNNKGWSTLGDAGWVDADGFLYLSDRRADLILSGGVNIYPREVEEALATHEAVADVAVIGVADSEMGERVTAVVQLKEGFAPRDELAVVLMSHAREHLSGFKCPRTIVFDDDLPRLPSGKLLRRQLKARFASQR